MNKRVLLTPESAEGSKMPVVLAAMRLAGCSIPIESSYAALGARAKKYAERKGCGVILTLKGEGVHHLWDIESGRKVFVDDVNMVSELLEYV